MSIKYQNSRLDVLLAILLGLRYSRRTQFFLIGVSPIPSMIYLLRRYLYRDILLVNDFVFASILGLGLFLALIVVSIFTKKLNTITLSIDQDGIKAKAGYQKGLIPWKMVTGVINKSGKVVILDKKEIAFLIPSSAFTNDEARTRFLELAIQYYAKASG